MNSNLNILIYECDHSGHRVDYINHLVNYTIQNNTNSKSVLFVLGEELICKLIDQGCKLNLVNLHSLNKVYLGEKNRNKLLLKDLEKLIDKNQNIEKVILMNFDLFIITFFKSAFLKNTLIKTILFRPFVHFPKVKLKDKIKYLIKKIILKLVIIRNKNIEKIFILNDHEAVSKLNKTFFKMKELDYKFNHLPDPVKNIMISNTKKIIDSQIIFLVIGTIDEKKNIIPLLKSLNSIACNAKELKIKLIIAGKISNHFKLELIDKCQFYGNSYVIEIIDKFLTETEFEKYMEISDSVFMAYKGFYSSSGILGHSISHLKPIIFSQGTLVEQIAKKYSIGFGCDPNSIDSIIDSVIEIIELTKDNNFIVEYLDRRKEFVLEYSPQRFCENLLN